MPIPTPSPIRLPILSLLLCPAAAVPVVPEEVAVGVGSTETVEKVRLMTILGVDDSRPMTYQVCL